MRTRATPSKVESRAPDGAMCVLSPTLSSRWGSGSCGGGSCGFAPAGGPRLQQSCGRLHRSFAGDSLSLVMCGRAGAEGVLITAAHVLRCFSEREKAQWS